MDSTTSRWPSVSIVIPAWNEGRRLDDVLRACTTQDYPGDWETILVDNGSTDGTKSTVRGYPKAKVLEERRHLRSPYSARNRGIEVARGDVIALLDASCVPRSNWLTEGIVCMQGQSSPGLVAGAVVFTFSDRPGAGELWDSIVNIQQERAVARGVAKTANLFVPKAVIAAQGLFREGVRSGEDVRWTGVATQAGWTLTYAERSIVAKAARGWAELLRKSARTGAGKAALMPIPVRLAKGIGSLLVPPAAWRVHHIVRERNTRPTDPSLLLRLWLTAWGARMSHGMGVLLPGLFRESD